VPSEDQGYFITIVQTPPGASMEYTTEICRRASAIIAKNPDSNGVFSVPGFSFGGSAPNRGLIFTNLKPMNERKGDKHSAENIVNSLRGPLMSISEGFVIPVLPPPIQGIGSFGGFDFELQQTGAGTLEEMENVMRGFMAKASQRKDLVGLYSDFSARDPQFVVNIDREKAKSLGVPFSQITSTLQTYMGSVYVNDFDFNNRSYRVYVQADQRFRSQPRDRPDGTA
jgi:hydrophobic/amphiphilic exporter-1 (mainly G- bacteria), HAE1 family